MRENLLCQFELIILYFDIERNLAVVCPLKMGHNCIGMFMVTCFYDEDSVRVFYPFYLFFFFSSYIILSFYLMKTFHVCTPYRKLSLPSNLLAIN